MAIVTKVYTPANVFQGPADVFIDVAPPTSSGTPTADANTLTLDANGQPTDAGLAAPAAPALSSVAGGALAAATYYAKITFVNPAGETLPSAESNLGVAANFLLQVAAPAPPAQATGWNVYVSTTAGTETKQNGANALAFGNPWILPTSGLVAGGALPAGNTTPAGFHVGSTEGPAQLSITEKFNEIRDDQHESPIDLAFDTVEAEIDVIVMETALANLQKYFTTNKLGTRTALASQDVLQLGGQLDATRTLRTLLLVAPRRDATGKWLYALAYAAYLKSAAQITFQRSKSEAYKLKFGCVMDISRAAGDEVLQIVRTK